MIQIKANWHNAKYDFYLIKNKILSYTNKKNKPTIKMIEKGEKDTSIENVSKLKRALPEIDLNSISISKLAS